MKTSKFKIGDRVEWICKPYGRQSFTANGIVKSILKSAIGGARRKIAIVYQIEPVGRYIKVYETRKKTTTIAEHKLSLEQ